MDRSPLLVVPYLDAPPIRDRRMEPEAWHRASGTTGFLDATTTLAARQTTVLAGFDETNLHLLFSSHSPAGITAETTDRDAEAVFSDDAVEVYLQPPCAGQSYYLLGGNALGTQFDARVFDESWDAEWTLVCEREYDTYFVAATWTAGLAIPFRSLGLEGPPPDNTEWRANFCRDWTCGLSEDDVAAGRRHTTWAPVGGSFHSPAKFGTLVFRRDAPAVRLASVGDLPRGSVRLDGKVSSPRESDVVFEWSVCPAGGSPEPVLSGRRPVAVTPPEPVPFRLEGDLGVPGTEPWPVTLVLSAAGGDGAPLYRQAIDFRAIPAFRVDIQPVYLRGFLSADFDVRSMPDLPAHAVGRVQLLADGEGVPAEARCEDLDRQKEASVRLDISMVDPGDYRVRVALEGADGTELVSRTEPLHIPPPPPWHNNRLGISDRVPPPWTPLSASDRTVQVWGRTYCLGDLPVPARIEIEGTEFLARPMRLVFADACGDRPWGEAVCELEHANDTQARFRFAASCGTARVRGSLHAEYDGFLLYDLEVEPLVDDASMPALSLEIPLHRRMAPFLRASRVPIDRWAAPEALQHALIGDVRPSHVPTGFAPGYSPEGWTWGEEFIPQFWVGDDFRGLFYFQDSPEQMNWVGSPLDVVEQGDETLLRFHFVSRSTPLERPLHYRFALQATPVRRRERRLERLAYGFDQLWDADIIGETDTAKGMIQGATLWEFGRVEKDYLVTDPERFRRIVANWRSHGVEVIVNIGSGFFVEGEEEFQRYGPEWMQQPPVVYPNHGGTDVSLVKVCPRSSFPDYFLWWLKGMIEDYDIGGIYLDLSGPVGCANPFHDCGYEQDGERRMTEDMFACREFYKRCYTFLKEEGAKRGREFYVFQHSAEGIVTPFVDMMTKGEGWSQAETFETLTPTYFRAAESWRHLGVPYTFFPTVSMPDYRQGKYRAPHREPLACTLLHDVLTVSHWKEQVEEDLLPIWQAWENFGIQDARWVPYFEHDPRVQPSDGDLLASFYLRTGRLMIVASNLTNAPIGCELRLDREGLGLRAGALPAREILSGDERLLEGDNLAVYVPAKNLAIWRIG